jgi:hypothetical protein
VTTNAGAATPGVDGEVWNTPELKAAAFSRLRRRVHAPKRQYILCQRLDFDKGAPKDSS